MSPHEFLELADELLAGVREGDWRSAASRAYYAAFHVARSVLERSGFVVPRNDQAHGYLWLRLSNAGHPDAVQAGKFLRDLRSARLWADYDINRPFPHRHAADQVALALAMISLLEALPTVPTALAAVIDAIRVYERDVLQDVTWRAPPASPP